MPALPTDTPTLTGDLVELRPVTAPDVVRLHALMRDPEVGRLTGSVHDDAETTGDPWTVEQLQEVYARWADDTDRVVWAVVDLGTGQVAGEAVLLDHDPDNASIGFRIWLGGARDRGLGTEATRLAVGHAFDVLGLHRVELEVYAFNPRARRVYEKVGFVLEGTKREALRYADRWVDCHVMGMLAQDWRRRRDRGSPAPGTTPPRPAR
ncbi:GNAT family N-acetyltransferase [uncultured Serinicoccus sp.]|uniref:GNAT family N-acetyltransferase n=1 Tax=uncultured Serinicoccus sp. TaxID=735514 RepID=UPI00260EA065|nr:GNAT family protein [uncultured Serinicoccus sp.]